jgi:transforming growth factor-beta-induced protein
MPEMSINTSSTTTGTLSPMVNETTMAPTMNETILSANTWNETTLSPTSIEITLPSTMDNGTIGLLGISATIAKVEDLQTLSVALEITGLADALGGTNDSSFTIFAPSDAAFDEMQNELVACLLRPENADSLIYILIHHVLPGAYFIGNLEPGPVTSMSGESLSISVTNGGVHINGMQTVISPDIEASNGVIHIIDGVLIPSSFDVESFLTACSGDSSAPTVTAGPTESPNPFDIPSSLLASRTVDKFAAWLYASELRGLLSEPNGPFTVFVPTNEAVDALPESLTSCLLGGGSGEALWVLLSYHVVERSILTTDMKDGMILETLSGSSLSVALLNGTIVLNNSTAIAASDFHAANGVIHIISEVLISPDFTIENIAELCAIAPPTAPVGAATSADASPPFILVIAGIQCAILTFLLIVLLGSDCV